MAGTSLSCISMITRRESSLTSKPCLDELSEFTGKTPFYFRINQDIIVMSLYLFEIKCKLIKTVDFPNHDIFVGEIVETYCDESCLTEGVVDFSKVRPILFVMNDTSYWKLGEQFAKAWNIGKALKKQ